MTAKKQKGFIAMNIYLVRHARQSSPLCNVNVDLSQEGLEQAALLAKRLKEISLDALYSSNLIRAVQTADIVNQYHNLKHEVREGIKEIDFGDMTGHEDAYIKQHYATFLSDNARMNADLPYPGGENGQDVVNRAMPVLKEIIESDKENVLVVTHGGVVRALTAHLLGMELSKKGMFGAALEHTSITEFVYRKETKQFYLQRFNDHAHLEGHPELMRHSWKG